MNTRQYLTLTTLISSIFDQKLVWKQYSATSLNGCSLGGRGEPTHCEANNISLGIIYPISHPSQPRSFRDRNPYLVFPACDTYSPALLQNPSPDPSIPTPIARFCSFPPNELLFPTQTLDTQKKRLKNWAGISMASLVISTLYYSHSSRERGHWNRTDNF